MSLSDLQRLSLHLLMAQSFHLPQSFPWCPPLSLPLSLPLSFLLTFFGYSIPLPHSHLPFLFPTPALSPSSLFSFPLPLPFHPFPFLCPSSSSFLLFLLFPLLPHFFYFPPLPSLLPLLSSLFPSPSLLPFSSFSLSLSSPSAPSSLTLFLSFPPSPFLLPPPSFFPPLPSPPFLSPSSLLLSSPSLLAPFSLFSSPSSLAFLSPSPPPLPSIFSSPPLPSLFSSPTKKYLHVRQIRLHNPFQISKPKAQPKPPTSSTWISRLHVRPPRRDVQPRRLPRIPSANAVQRLANDFIIHLNENVSANHQSKNFNKSACLGPRIFFLISLATTFIFLSASAFVPYSTYPRPLPIVLPPSVLTPSFPSLLIPSSSSFPTLSPPPSFPTTSPSSSRWEPGSCRDLIAILNEFSPPAARIPPGAGPEPRLSPPRPPARGGLRCRRGRAPWA
ncbi:hypothetical protein C7M84_020162 [Penaeus vannamei]|uniref:Uncharacterized protein n=1 Tax=Penaeus vannamei TaxID=6689 RepID=A0A423SCU4_PENVA|nr:hypothetical protein C7M84_020162 [Penaeus vannamei]